MLAGDKTKQQKGKVAWEEIYNGLGLEIKSIFIYLFFFTNKVFLQLWHFKKQGKHFRIILYLSSPAELNTKLKSPSP